MHEYCGYLRTGVLQIDRIDTLPLALISVRRAVEHATGPVCFRYWLDDHCISGFFRSYGLDR